MNQVGSFLPSRVFSLLPPLDPVTLIRDILPASIKSTRHCIQHRADSCGHKPSTDMCCKGAQRAVFHASPDLIQITRADRPSKRCTSGMVRATPHDEQCRQGSGHLTTNA